MEKRWILPALLTLCCLPGLYAQRVDSLNASSLSATGLGQYNLQRRNVEFLERVVSFSSISWVTLPYTDIGYDDPKSPYILSADVAPHFNIGGESWPVVLQITPRYVVRILRDHPADGDSSWAVRTPSYMPGASLFIPLSHSPFKRARKYSEAPELDNGYRDLHYLGITAVHHSNGQDGREILATGKYNTYNGNFSTNFVEVAYNYNIRHRLRNQSPFDCPNPTYPVGYRDYYGRIGYEQHFNSAEGLRGRYGQARINATFGWLKIDNYRFTVGIKNQQPRLKKIKQPVGQCYRKERYRFQINFSANVDELDPGYDELSQRLNVDIGYFKRILGGNTAVFIMAGYYGTDPYNVYFESSYPFVRAGLALGFFTFTNKTE
jgi:hypothetical protein